MITTSIPKVAINSTGYTRVCQQFWPDTSEDITYIRAENFYFYIKINNPLHKTISGMGPTFEDAERVAYGSYERELNKVYEQLST